MEYDSITGYEIYMRFVNTVQETITWRKVVIIDLEQKESLYVTFLLKVGKALDFIFLFFWGVWVEALRPSLHFFCSFGTVTQGLNTAILVRFAPITLRAKVRHSVKLRALPNFVVVFGI